jgi:hypothetical protein
MKFKSISEDPLVHTTLLEADVPLMFQAVLACMCTSLSLIHTRVRARLKGNKVKVKFRAL